MGIATSLVALALLGADPVQAPTPAQMLLPATAAETGDMITCRMQMTTVEGLAWRAAAYPRLTSIGQKGSNTIWIADRAFKTDLQGGKDAQFQTVEAATITTFKDATGTVINRGPFQYIGDVERVADGPINQATQVVFAPKGTSVEIGFTSEFSGRRLDQGVLARIKVAETHIGTIHQVGVSEFIYPPQEDASTALTPAGKQIFQHFIKADAAKVSAPLMVPEVASSEVAGEWLVPNDSVLVISMGIDTVTNPAGKPIIQERLAIYDFARPSDTTRDIQKAALLGRPTRASTTADLDLPPLPEAYASANLNQIEPGSPLATTEPIGAARRLTDPQLARTALAADDSTDDAIEAVDAAADLAHVLALCPGSGPIPAVIETFLRSSSDGEVTPESAQIASNGLSMPRVPDRSYPAATTPDGATYDLPPLPEGYASTDLDQIKPGSPLASPQTTTAQRSRRSMSDPQVARTSLQPIPDSEIEVLDRVALPRITPNSGEWDMVATQPCPASPMASLVEKFLRSGMDQPSPLKLTGTVVLSTPRVPDRSYPAATTPDGMVYDLPPLPEAYASADLNQIAPGRPQASPQTIGLASASRPMVDPQLAQTAFASTPVETAVITVINGEPITRAQLAAEATCRRPDAATLSEHITARVDQPQATCPAAANCPYSADGCDSKNQPALPSAAKIEMGVSVRDGKGTCVYNTEDDLVAALRTPGQTETKLIPLGGNMSLRIEAKVVPTPKVDVATQRSAYRPASAPVPFEESRNPRFHGGADSDQPGRFADPYDSELPATGGESATTVMPIPLAEPTNNGPRTWKEIAARRRNLDVYQKHEIRFLDTRNQLTPATSNAK